MELINFPQSIKDQVYKLLSVNLCSNLEGQLFMGLVCHPPREGDPSFPLFQKERDTVLHSLKTRAKLIEESLNSIPGVNCNPIEGAMYAFPRLSLPAKAQLAAKKIGKLPDTFYCLELLGQTGLVVVPGSGFGQKLDTWHLRTTILPPVHKLARVLEKMKVFHKSFLAHYS